MPQTRERRMYLYWRSLRRSRAYAYEHYRKGWLPGPLMMVARRFRAPIREVREIIEIQRGR